MGWNCTDYNTRPTSQRRDLSPATRARYARQAKAKKPKYDAPRKTALSLDTGALNDSPDMLGDG